MGGPKAKEYVYNPDTNSWVKGDVRHLKGCAGAQSMGFHFGERGYFIVEGQAAREVTGLQAMAFRPPGRKLAPKCPQGDQVISLKPA